MTRARKPRVKAGTRRMYIDMVLFLYRQGGLGEECVMWPYGVTGHGKYASTHHAGKTMHVSHIMLTETARPRPEAPRNNALHSCDTPRCIHPDHLRWGTHDENMWDSYLRGRRPQRPRTLLDMA